MNYSNVFIIPILCMEYYVLKMLDFLGVLVKSKNVKVLLDNLLYSFNWDSVPLEYKDRSLERLYKLILSSQPKRCLINKKDEDNPNFGLFYKSSCPCEPSEGRCKLRVRIDKMYKAELLVVQLPVFDIISDEHRHYIESIGYSVRNLSLKDLHERLSNMYSLICKELNVSNLYIRFRLSSDLDDVSI